MMISRARTRYSRPATSPRSRRSRASTTGRCSPVHSIARLVSSIGPTRTADGVAQDWQAPTRSDRRLTLEHEAVEEAALVHVIVGIGLMHDAAVIPQHPVAMAPLVTILVFFMRGVPHQVIDQRQRLPVLHADDGFHTHGIEE